MAKKKRSKSDLAKPNESYGQVLSSMVELLETARRTSARAVNSIMTATYWEIGRRIVEFEQEGQRRAEYGAEIVSRFAADLKKQFGRGFSKRNVEQMRLFYLAWPIAQTLSAQSDSQNLPKAQPALQNQHSNDDSDVKTIHSIAKVFPLPWSHYVRLLSLDDDKARNFYEDEALRSGWSVRQLDRQISSKFYERTLLSKNKAAMLKSAEKARPGDLVSPEEEIKDPFVLEFLDLKDEYSERDLEEALIVKLEEFLLELGSDFTFVGRQKRLRIGKRWYRIDLLFFHRRLRCLVIIDLKLGEFSHADAGQMHMYLNYAAEHWTHEDENPPVGLILCAENDAAAAHYALDGLPNQVMASEYKLALPDEKLLAEEIEKTKRYIETHHSTGAKNDE